MANRGVDLDQALQRAGDYWERDGLPAIALAVICLGSGFWLYWRPRSYSFQLNLLFTSLWIFILLSFFHFVVRRNSSVMNWMKARITYPRTGYVALPSESYAKEKLKQQDWKRHPEVWVFLSMIFSEIVNTPWVGTILVMLTTSVVWIVTKGRFPLAGILIPGSYLSALLLPFLPVAQGDRMAYFFIAFGLLYLLAGTTQLVGYLHRHPAPRA